jgi:PPOX class probable F420-dependent enzyme
MAFLSPCHPVTYHVKELAMAMMTRSEIEVFLQAPRHAILATNGGDGSPQLSPVWFIYEEGRLYISAGIEAVKVRNLRRDLRLSVCIDAGHPDARYVVLRGVATILEPHDPLQETMRWRIIRHYHASEPEALAYYASVRDFESVLLVVTPEKIISQDFNG